MTTTAPQLLPYLERLLDGETVEWKTLGEVCKIVGRIGFRGYTRNDIVEKGNGAISLSPTNIINQNLVLSADKNTYISWDKYFESPEIMIKEGDIILAKTASVGKAALIRELTEKATINPQMVVLKDILCNSAYLSHYINTLDFQLRLKSLCGQGSVPNISQAKLSTIPIPLPPLRVQARIVEILDKFTQLEAELEAELEARNKQYDFYRNRLLDFAHRDDFAGQVEWKTLGEVAELVRGNGLSKKDFSEFGVPAIHYGQIYTYYGNETQETLSFVSPETAKRLKKVYPGNIVITNTSENIEDVGKSVLYSGSIEAVTGGHATIIRTKDCILPKYLVYYTLTLDFFTQKKRLAKGTKVIDVSAKDLAKIIIPLPPLSEQRRIVEILDRFDTLTNSISEGLPREIALRRKQYEYYRDALLRFPPPAPTA